jgi:hypothetical protein
MKNFLYDWAHMHEPIDVFLYTKPMLILLSQFYNLDDFIYVYCRASWRKIKR